MAQPIKFGGRESITSYDFNDIVSGTGIQTFYGGSHAAGSSAETLLVSGSILSDDTFYSFHIVQKVLQTGAFNTWHDVKEYNFDLEFNTTRMVNGDVLVSIPMGMNTASANVIMDTRGKINFYSVNSSDVETLIVSGMTGIFTKNNGTSNTAYSKIITTAFPFTNQVFSPGEKLRLELTQQVRFDSGVGVTAGIGSDPMNRNDEGSGADKIIDDATDTILSLKVPFKLEVD